MGTYQGIVNPDENVFHFGKPKFSLSVVQILKTEICDQKSTIENADFFWK